MKNRVAIGFLSFLIACILFAGVFPAQTQTFTKRLIGTQDIAWAIGGTGAAETFTQTTADGHTLTLNKLDATNLKFRTAQDGAAKSIEALVDGSKTVHLKPKDIDTDAFTATTITGTTLIGDLKAQGPWIDARLYGTLALADAAAVAAGKPILISSAWVISANLAIASPVIALEGADFQIATTKTLTVNGNLEAGLYQIFTLTGTGKVQFGPGAIKAVIPQWFGAKADGATNDSAAIPGGF